ncbi:integrin alpha-8-like isoform X2 [Vespa mandarinia]|uniref:integrin alpha-8-like isoform X2 n=1 Tax=Vespa mandarinia TaxID=7446 RepID=UPI00161FFB23|nr:integrin alpha-8-like isoform X2 [Vespa mandarinia]
MWLCGFLFKIFLSNTLAYNLDITNAIVFTTPQSLEGRRNSYFGYATALYTSSKNVSAVLIGVPRANISDLQSVLEPGTVYVCLLDKMCKEWIIDNSEDKIYQNRNNSWIGGVVLTENNRINSNILVCAPRWKYINNKNWYMNGMCYWTTATSIESFEKEAEKMALITINDNQLTSWNGNFLYNFGMGQLGFSADMRYFVNKSDLSVVLGSPGIFNWKGSTVLLTESTSGYRQIIIPNNKNIYMDINYLGYSTTSGFYFSKQELLFASSSPRSNNMKGYVIIYSFPKYSGKTIDISNTLNGYQYGEYFGASLASCDLNNDDKDDLIVGAPLWTKDMDEGRNNFMKKQEIDGNVSGGRFGSSITCLGDIDYDGYNDIMIGAPYEGDSGAIYLYNSNKNGILKCSQKILGSEFSPNICGFGISISKPLDINNDKYLDIAIGAYLSEQVVLLPSIPVVSITIDLVYSGKKLSRDSKFFFIYICTIYDGVYAPKNLNIIRNLEIDPLYGRAMYLKNNTSNFTCILPTVLKISERQCDLFKIHLKDNIQNVIDPITLSVDFNNTMQESNKSSNIFHKSSVIINKLNSKLKDVIQLPFLLECGTDDICNSDLRISLRTNLTSNNTYIIGSSSNLKLIVDVHNNGEPAYQTQVHIFIPNPLSLESIPPACMESSWTNKYNLQVICDLGNPLTNATNETMILELDTSKIRFDVKSLELYANVTTQSEEINQLDKNYTMTIYFDIDVDIAIAGKAQDNVYSYSRKDEKNSQNIKFKHIYEVQKFGRSPINEAILMVEIPTYWKNKDYDIELININHTIAHMDGNILKLKINDLDHCKNCQTFKRETINEFIDEFDMNNKSVNIYTRNETKIKYEENFTNTEKLVINTPVENRILFINCSNPMIVCKQIECKLNPFTSSLSVAQLIITLDFKLLNIPSFMLENKNIILFASKGTVNITQPSNVIQGSTNKPDTTMIITKFQGSPINERVAVWILALSIFLGIILLILIILGLIKLGFFHRKRKEQLEALKAISNENNSKILEIISSEVLDQE